MQGHKFQKRQERKGGMCTQPGIKRVCTDSRIGAGSCFLWSLLGIGQRKILVCTICINKYFTKGLDYEHNKRRSIYQRSRVKRSNPKTSAGSQSIRDFIFLDTSNVVVCSNAAVKKFMDMVLLLHSRYGLQISKIFVDCLEDQDLFDIVSRCYLLGILS